jgi:hypothetical protein
MVRHGSPCLGRGSGLRRVAAAILLAVMSCAPWASIPPPAPGSLPPTEKLQVWIRGRSIVLREVNISPDSIAGQRVVPLGPADWIVVPRADVDSFRIEPRDQGSWFGAGFGVGLLAGVVGLMALWRASAGGT